MCFHALYTRVSLFVMSICVLHGNPHQRDRLAENHRRRRQDRHGLKEFQERYRSEGTTAREKRGMRTGPTAEQRQLQRERNKKRLVGGRSDWWLCHVKARILTHTKLSPPCCPQEHVHPQRRVGWRECVCWFRMPPFTSWRLGCVSPGGAAGKNCSSASGGFPVRSFSSP